MTTNAYRRRQQALDAAYNRAACWLVAFACLAVTAAWARLLVKVLF